jgi:hypothetical protein
MTYSAELDADRWHRLNAIAAADEQSWEAQLSLVQFDMSSSVGVQV